MQELLVGTRIVLSNLFYNTNHRIQTRSYNMNNTLDKFDLGSGITLNMSTTMLSFTILSILHAKAQVFSF